MAVPVQTILSFVLITVPFLYAELFAAFLIFGRIIKRGTTRSAAASAGVLLGTVLLFTAVAIGVLRMGGFSGSGPSLDTVLLAGIGALIVYWTIGTLAIKRFYGLETKRALISFIAIWMALSIVNTILNIVVQILGAVFA